MAKRERKSTHSLAEAENAATQAPEQTAKVVGTANDLIAEEIKIDDFLKAQTKAFGEFCKPHKDRQAEIQNLLLALLNQQQVDSIKGDAGTCYKSNILNVGIDSEGTDPYVPHEGGTPRVGREAFLDFSLDNWEAFGQNGLMFSAQKDSVKKYIEEHGKPPPGIKISYFTRINIRRS